MTLQEFTDVFAPLAIQLRATDADEATIRVYYAALKDLELEFVQMAATTLATKAEWFPKTSEWREAAVIEEINRLGLQKARIMARQKACLPPLCAACDDTGWRRSMIETAVVKCECRHMRRLEVLGRRPMPALPEMSHEG
jgi:hypothetical protein